MQFFFLDCGVFVNSRCWFLEILAISLPTRSNVIVIYYQISLTVLVHRLVQTPVYLVSLSSEVSYQRKRLASSNTLINRPATRENNISISSSKCDKTKKSILNEQFLSHYRNCLFGVDQRSQRITLILHMLSYKENKSYARIWY